MYHHMTTNHVRSWNILEQKLMSKKDRGILKQMLICVYGRLLLLTTCMMNTQLRSSCMKIQLNQLCGQCLRAIMLRYLPMVRQAQARPTPWKASSIQVQTHRGVSFPVQWKKSLGSSRCKAPRTQLSWCVQVTCRSTTK